MTAERAWTGTAGERLAAEGLLRQVGGWTVVQGVSEDALSGRRALFLRWIPAELARREAELDGVVRAALADCDVDEVILHLPHDQSPPPGWRRRELYLRWRGGDGTAEPPRSLGGVSVRPAAGAEDRQFIASLLTRALRVAYGEEGAHLEEAPTMEYVTGEILGSDAGHPRSWVARDSSGRRSGHITVLEDTDDLTGEPFLECLDMFVLESDQGGPSSRLLVGAAATYAARRGLPLLGHVICTAGWEDVAARLRARGWADDHSLWVRPASTTPAEGPR